MTQRMVGDLNYAHEKYASSVRTLALLDSNLRARLIAAYTGGASLVGYPKDGLGPPLDEDLAERISNLHARLTERSDDDQGAIAATINAMTDDDIHSAAEELLEIAGELDWAWHEAHPR